MATDQRYCLACGERRTPMSSVLAGGPPRSPAQPVPGAPAPVVAPSAAFGAGHAKARSDTLTVIAGVGVLMLAMGVGVLIGRSGNSKPAAVAAAPAVTVASTAPIAAAPTAAPESFTGDWRSGTTGFTVQLQTLPQSGTQVSAVQAAKTAAIGKGAKGVGALKSEQFSSLPSGNFVIYSGVYHKKAEAQKALGGLKKSFPGASVVEVSNHSSSAAAENPNAATEGTGVGSLSHPAPPSVLEGKAVKGKSYEQKSKELPNVIETG